MHSTWQKLKSESDPADQISCLLAYSLTLFLFFCSKFCTKFSKQPQLRCVNRDQSATGAASSLHCCRAAVGLQPATSPGQDSPAWWGTRPSPATEWRPLHISQFWLPSLCDGGTAATRMLHPNLPGKWTSRETAESVPKDELYHNC